jgi:hypothetical protein
MRGGEGRGAWNWSRCGCLFCSVERGGDGKASWCFGAALLHCFRNNTLLNGGSRLAGWQAGRLDDRRDRLGWQAGGSMAQWPNGSILARKSVPVMQPTGGCDGLLACGLRLAGSDQNVLAMPCPALLCSARASCELNQAGEKRDSVAEVSARANQLLGSAMGCLDDSQPENQSPLSRMLVPVTNRRSWT